MNESAREKAEWSEAAEARKIGGGSSESPKNFRSYMGEKSRKQMARAKAIDNRRERAIEENERAQAKTESEIADAEVRGDFEGMQRLCVALGQLQEQESLLYEALERAETERAQLEKEAEA